MFKWFYPERNKQIALKELKEELIELKAENALLKARIRELERKEKV